MTSKINRIKYPVRLMVLGAVLAGLAGCSGGLPSISQMNPFKKEEPKLPGERISVLNNPNSSGGGQSYNRNIRIALASIQANPGWTQPGGSIDNSPGHLSLSGGLKTVWSSSSGEGSSSDGHLTSSPLVHNGRVYTLDADGVVRAFSANGGKRIWQTSTTPENEDDSEGYGGGLAINNGRLFAATGYGTVVGLNLANGKKLWEKKLGVPVRSSPTAAQDRIFVVSTEGQLYCLSGIDGAELWNYRGLPEAASLLSNTSPAVSGNVVVVPFNSGEVSAFNVANGKILWNESLTRRRRGSAFSSFSTVATPSVSDGIVFAVSHSGRMIAARKSNGERLWSKNIASNQKPVASGNSVFVVDTSGKMHALSKKGGDFIWTAELPKQGTWSGPVLAGNRLWAVSSKGLIVGVSAASGQISSKRDLDTRIYIAPIVAQNKMYIYTDKARLMALN